MQELSKKFFKYLSANFRFTGIKQRWMKNSKLLTRAHALGKGTYEQAVQGLFTAGTSRGYQ